MFHDTDIIATLTVAVVAATIGGHLAALVRMPPILGFLLAGVAVGPFTPGPTADSSVANQLAEFGIILLMFGVGIHFSLRDLRAVLRIVVPAALAQTLLVTLLVAGLMSFWGWGWGTGLLMGLAISIASTVIVVHAFDQRGERDSLHGRVAIGWLVIEDLLTVFILILVPLLASQGVGNSSAEEIGEAVGVGMAQVVTFSAGMMLIGNRVAPQLLLLTARLNSRELRLVTVLALALGVGYGASTLFDVSYALGAFLAGLVVSEAEISHQAAADALPLQDAFAALFFVSVGMLFDPRFLLEEPVLVAVVVLLIVVAKPVITQLLLSALRFPDRPGLLISASRAQIGEFSFILGSIGMAEGLINDGQMSLILAGSIISIVLSPLIFNSAGRISMRITGGLSLRLPGREFTLEPAPHSALHEHAVILGGGRVGGLIITEMLELEIPVIVADYRRDVIDRLRAAGVPVIYGDVANPQLLRHLHLECARVLVVAISDELAARLAVERARQIRPDLPIVVRTHTEHERLYLDNLPYTEAVMGEREMAVEMASFALRQFGLSLGELDAVEQDMRSRSSDEPLPGQPLPLE
ncbi:MAG TPA: cation:proton antiporter [Thermomicrobiales bacterium]|nr:cation:proton antiporter [Thermomicrobiales bacterium]